MKKQLIIFGIVIVALAVFGGWYASQNGAAPGGETENTAPQGDKPVGALVPPAPPAATPAPTSTAPTGTNAPKPPTKGITMADVASHATAASCWTAISENVYDLTKWVGEHPGGTEAILSICGKDGTKAFEGQHGGALRPERELAKFLIGALAQ